MSHQARSVLLLRSLMAAFLFAVTAAAQVTPPTPMPSPLAGTYEWVRDNGDPVEAGHTWTCTVTETSPGVFEDVVRRDGKRWPQEESVYYMNGFIGWFETAKGNWGTIFWTAEGWQCVMQSGAHAGTVTVMKPI